MTELGLKRVNEVIMNTLLKPYSFRDKKIWYKICYFNITGELNQ